MDGAATEKNANTMFAIFFYTAAHSYGWGLLLPL